MRVIRGQEGAQGGSMARTYHRIMEKKGTQIHILKAHFSHKQIAIDDLFIPVKCLVNYERGYR